MEIKELMKEQFAVLIVAKCIVNHQRILEQDSKDIGINSSKVYCKWI